MNLQPRLLALVITTGLSAAQAASSTGRPDILLRIADDDSRCRFGGNGDRVLPSPVIDDVFRPEGGK